MSVLQSQFSQAMSVLQSPIQWLAGHSDLARVVLSYLSLGCQAEGSFAQTKGRSAASQFSSNEHGAVHSGAAAGGSGPAPSYWMFVLLCSKDLGQVMEMLLELIKDSEAGFFFCHSCC